jgi:hypothetical protein
MAKLEEVKVQEVEVQKPVSENVVLVNEPTSAAEYDKEHEEFYRKLRENEAKDDLAIRILNLPNENSKTHDLKELAAIHLANRFK